MSSAALHVWVGLAWVSAVLCANSCGYACSWGGKHRLLLLLIVISLSGSSKAMQTPSGCLALKILLSSWQACKHYNAKHTHKHTQVHCASDSGERRVSTKRDPKFYPAVTTCIENVFSLSWVLLESGSNSLTGTAHCFLNSATQQLGFGKKGELLPQVLLNVCIWMLGLFSIPRVCKALNCQPLLPTFANLLCHCLNAPPLPCFPGSSSPGNTDSALTRWCPRA